MQMRNKKLLAWPMVLMLGLLSTGVAYAHWSQTIYVEGQVETGELDWCFTVTGNLDPPTPQLPPNGIPDYHSYDGFAGWIYWQGDKDVGYTTVVVTDCHTVTVTLNNVYPSYFNAMSVYAVNTGTIPLIIDNVIIDGNILRASPTPVIRLDLDGDDLDDIEIWWGDGFGTQIHPGYPSPEMSFWVHVLQDAPQGATGATLSFTIELVAVQYNLYDPPEP